jgi:tetratricopeptide (TPR) repeat protein
MSEDECLDLLFSRSELESNDENISDAKSVVAQLWYLPLAVDQAGAYISAQNLSMSLFAKHFQERKAHILRYTPSLTEYRKKLNDSDAETALNVFTTLELSLQGICGSDDSREAIEDFLTLSAFFSSISIGEDLFKTAVTKHRPGWRNIFTVGDIWDHYKYQDTLANLDHLSLLHGMSPGDVTYFSLHPLVADWLKLRRDMAFSRTCTLQTGSVLEELIYSQDSDAMQLGPRQYLLAHIDSCLYNQRLYLNTLDYESKAVLDQLHAFGYLLQRSGLYKEAEEILQSALQGKENTVGANHISTLQTVNNLGHVYEKQGKLKEAEEMYQRALQGKENAVGTHHISTLKTVNNLGLVYWKQGRLREAEEMYQRALQGYKKTLGSDHPSTIQTAQNLNSLRKLEHMPSV